jgi:hypothetical protein
MLYFWDLPFVLLGIYLLIASKEKSKFAVFWWFLVAPAASALTTGTPHAVRSLLYLPTFQIFSAYGLYQFYLWSRGKLSYYKANVVLIFIFSLLIFNFIYYLHMYYVHTPIEVSQDWQYGYKQVVKEVTRIEKNYQKIVVTYAYDQPYIYWLFYQKVDPAWYQKQAPKGEIDRFYRSFGKYEFRYLTWEKDQKLSKTLLVGMPLEIPNNTSGNIANIKYLNSDVAFRIVALP